MDAEGAAGRDRVCVGAIAGAHGVKGTVRIRSFTGDPVDVASYGPVRDEAGSTEYELEVIGMSAGTVLAQIAGIDGRAAAEALKGTRLYVARAALPDTDSDEFYHGDLLGLAAALADGTMLGPVIAIHPAGATEVLEIGRGRGQETLMVPFTRAAVPEIDLAAGRMVVVPPQDLDDAVEFDEGGGDPEK